MCSLGINGGGESTRHNPGLPGKWPLKYVCVSETSAVVHVEPTTNVG